MASSNVKWGLTVGCLVVGCGGSDGGPDLRGDGGLIGEVLVSTTAEPAGDHCATGGAALTSGVDKNGDGVLQAAEVTSTAYVCNGAGLGSCMRGVLVDSTILAAGDPNCPDGGVAISQGTDSNANGVLDASEVKGTAYACNGDQTSLSRLCAFPSAWDAKSSTCAPRTDWSKANLAGVNLASTYLAGVSLPGANLTNAKLMWSDLTGANLAGADLTGSDLSNARVRGADFTNAILNGSNLAGVDLSKTQLTGVSATQLVSCPADLPDGWRCMDLGAAGKSLVGPGSTLHGLDLTGANLAGAQLSGPRFLASRAARHSCRRDGSASPWDQPERPW